MLSLTDMFMKFNDVVQRDLLLDATNFQKETKFILYADTYIKTYKNPHSKLSFLPELNILTAQWNRIASLFQTKRLWFINFKNIRTFLVSSLE